MHTVPAPSGHWCFYVTNITHQPYLPCCRGCFLSNRRNAWWRRVWGGRGKPPCHRILKRFLFCITFPPFPIPVDPTCGAQGHLWRPAHLLSLCDVWYSFHHPFMDYWAECEWLTMFKLQKMRTFSSFTLSFATAVMDDTQFDSAVACLLCFLAAFRLHQGKLRKRGHPL